MKENPIIDPLPELWLTEDKLNRFLGLFTGKTLEILALSGQLRDVIKYWIRLQICLEIKDDELIWPSADLAYELDSLREDWLQKFSIEGLCLNSDLLDIKLLVTPACKKWSYRQWSYKLESLYLEKKDSLDQASCRLIRLSEKNLAHELYYRFLANESTFEQLAVEYGEGPEKFQGGVIPLQRLSNMPLGLDKVLKTLQPEKVMPPARLGEGFALVQLISWEPAVLDDKISNQLLQFEFTCWLESVASYLQQVLTPLSQSF